MRVWAGDHIYEIDADDEVHIVIDGQEYPFNPQGLFHADHSRTKLIDLLDYLREERLIKLADERSDPLAGCMEAYKNFND